MKIHVLGTGLSGLVGSRVRELLEDSFEFTDLSLTTGVDITNYDQVLQSFANSSAATVLHMAAKTDVDSCEDDKIYQEEGAAWQVNVVGTQNIVDAAKKYNKRVIYISTDFVFDGTSEIYTEDMEANPLNFYGVTKYEGEKIVKEADINFTIVRLAYPYRAYYRERVDFVRAIMERLQKKETIFALTDHIFTPTFIDDIAIALRLLLSREFIGIFHVVGSQSLTPFEGVGMIMDKFHLTSSVQEITRENFFRGRAFRPFKLRMNNDKISKLGIQLKTFSEGLDEIKKQLENI